MPGKRDKNLRSGDLHEDLGIFLLKSVALVATVPRQEDAGCDAFATLTRPEGNRRLIPDVSFLVQFKSASVKSVVYTGVDEIGWITALEYPLLIGRVDRELARIEIFSTLRLQQVLLEMPYRAVELLLDQQAETAIIDGERKVNLGPPIHAWSVADTTATSFQMKAYQVLQPHVDVLRNNLLLRGIQTQRCLRWETGEPPTDNGEMMLVSPGTEFADTLLAMVPYARRLMLEMIHRERYRDFPVMLALFDLMRRWGADPDSNGALRLLAGLRAGGPEISVEDAISLRYALSPTGSLDLNGLPISDASLMAIPETVIRLALINAPITDSGIHHLLRLKQLKRLNISGTLITDEGVVVLVRLRELEWICVNRTRVTSEGIARLLAGHPGLIVVIDSDPSSRR